MLLVVVVVAVPKCRWCSLFFATRTYLEMCVCVCVCAEEKWGREEGGRKQKVIMIKGKEKDTCGGWGGNRENVIIIKGDEKNDTCCIVIQNCDTCSRLLPSIGRPGEIWDAQLQPTGSDCDEPITVHLASQHRGLKGAALCARSDRHQTSRQGQFSALHFFAVHFKMISKFIPLQTAPAASQTKAKPQEFWRVAVREGWCGVDPHVQNQSRTT